MQDIEKLTALRQAIIDNIVPLLDSESLEPLERFKLLSRLAQAQGKATLYEKAFNVASSLGEEERLQSYMTLLDDVDYEIDNAASGEVATAAPQPTQPQPVQPAQNQ